MTRKKGRIFFLPNHNIRWLKRVIQITRIRMGKILIIGSPLYAAYLPKNFNVTVIDKNFLALISQLYILWLKQQNYSNKKIKKILFLNKFGNRFKFHRRFKLVSELEYLKSLSIFKQFLTSFGDLAKGKNIEKNFQRIFNLRKDKNKFYIYLIPKGLNSDDLLKIKPVRKLEEIKFINISLENFKTHKKFNFIISTNVIENFDKPFTFFKYIGPLLTEKAGVELTTYNKYLAQWLKYLKILINSKKQALLPLGKAYIFKGKNDKLGRECTLKLILNKSTFIFSKKEVNKILKIISEKQFLPTWIREIKTILKFPIQHRLFKSREKAYLIKNKRLIRIC